MKPQTKIRQHPERSVPEEYREILLEGRVAHVGFSLDGQPYVIPFLYHYDSEKPDCLYLHGAHNSRALRRLADGAPVCLEVTLLDGLVYSRTALYHSANYRSVIAFGRAKRIIDPGEKAAVFEEMTGRYFPGRTAGRDYEKASAAHLKATEMLELTIESWSAKARRGGPKGPTDGDEQAPGSAGVLEYNRFV